MNKLIRVLMKSRNVDFLEKIFLVGKYEIFQIIWIEETVKFSTQFLGDGGELNPQMDIGVTMIAKDNDWEIAK